MSSEFLLIDKYFRESGLSFPTPEIVLGIGDDCSLISIPSGYHLAQSMDTLVADVHFPASADPYLLGCRALAVNLSDLAAMGARPLSFSLALSLPQQFSANADDLALESWLARFSQGLAEYAKRYYCPLIGGDTTRGPLSITIQAQGAVTKGLRRSAAKLGDHIYVTGQLGAAALALPVLEKESHIAPLNRLSDSELTALKAAEVRQHFLDAYFKPEPPVAFAQAAAEIINAAIDISDGLMADLDHICTASGVAAEIQSNELPLSMAAKLSLGENLALAAALTGGDDYQLCFTVSAKHSERVQQIAAAENIVLSRIGKITPENPARKASDSSVRVLDKNGAVLKIDATGYDHFL